MGKKGKWLGAVKKVFSPESKEKGDQVHYVLYFFLFCYLYCFIFSTVISLI